MLLGYSFASTWRYRKQSWTSKKKIKNLSSCHWNVKSLIAHNLSKTSLLEAYNANCKHDFLCISEKYLDSSVLEGDKNMQLIRYNMTKADHSSNANGGGAYIFYREILGVRIVNLSNLSKCIICEVSIQNNKGYVGVVYRSPGQDAMEFQNFLSYFETILSNTTTKNA